jgi:hypothetical protein
MAGTAGARQFVIAARSSLRASAKQSTDAGMDCFVAEPVLGQREALIRVLLAMTVEQGAQ